MKNLLAEQSFLIHVQSYSKASILIFHFAVKKKKNNLIGIKQDVWAKCKISSSGAFLWE